MNRKNFYWAALIICGLLLYGLYWAVHSPYYALVQAGKSLVTHDFAGFEKFADVNSLTTSSVQQLIEVTEAYPAMQEQINLPRLKQEQEQIIDALNQLVRTYIDRGELDYALLQKLEQLSLGSPLPFAIDPSKIEWKVEKTSSSEASLTIFMPTPYGIKLPLKAKMIQSQGKWRVTEITELGKALQPVLTLQSFLR